LEENFHQFNFEIHKEKEMADFRKWIPLLAVVALLGIVSTASAQIPFSCSVNQAVPNQVRAEDIAALTGDILIQCQGGTPTAAGVSLPLVNVQVFLNTNVTSKILVSGSTTFSEALMMFDEPTPAQQVTCDSTQLPASACAVKGVAQTAAAPLSPYKQTGAANIFQGQVVGNNSVLWLAIPVDPPGTTNPTFLRNIRITNIRANANQLGVSSTLIPSSILAFISATPNTSLPISNPTQTVAFVQQGLAFSATAGTFPVVYAQCVSNNATITATSGITTDYTITFKENFPVAFKLANASPAPSGVPSNSPTAGVVPTVDQNIPGTNYGTESGFYSSTGVGATAFSGNLAGAGLASAATRVMAKFAGIPTGVTLYVTVTQTNTGTANPWGTTANLVVGSDNNGNGGTFAVASNGAGTLSGGGKQALFAITSTGTGTGIAVWELTKVNLNQIDQVSFGVTVSYTSNTAQNLPALGNSNVSGTFAPISTTTTAVAGAPVPRFADTSGGNTTAAFTINACVTDILFPFVTNQAGFDTGVAIANTSLDPWATTAQTGPCTLYYFGATTGGGAAPNAQTSGNVAAGTELVFSLSSGGANGVAATPGFQGYMIATCYFQYAHAFAFISDLGAQKLAEGYLGILLDSGGNVTRTAPNGTGPSTTRVESRTF